MSISTLDGVRVKTITTSRIIAPVLFSGSEVGAPVLFLDGNVSGATFWQETMLALPEGFYGIAPEQRGYGAADFNTKIDATHGMMDLADDLLALMDYLTIDKAHLVGHSLGGSVLWSFMMAYPERILSVTQAAPGSPYGFGGTKDLEGRLCYEDGAGSGGGIVSPDFVKAIAAQDRSSTEQTSPRVVMNNFYWKPPFIPKREEEFLSAMLAVHVGEEDYPGDAKPSENWPMVAPGKFGPANALSPLYAGDVSRLYRIEPKPPVLWIRGADDQIVSDASLFELGTLGKLGAIPGWPGEDIFPSQPMVGQTRAVLEKYQAAGGTYKEIVFENTGHTPYIEKSDEFNQHFHAHIQMTDA